MSDLDDLIEFFLARIAEDEREAGDADEQRLWRWSQHDRMIINDAGHMQRFTPSRMLRECEAKRRIVEEYAERDSDVALMLGPNTLRQREWSGLRLAVHALASVYSDHPDYREEWKP